MSGILRGMALRVWVEPVEVGAPTVAARAVTDAVEAEAPRGREPIVVWLGADDRPGHAPAPWTADGVFEALGATARLSVAGPSPRVGPHPSADEGPFVELSLPGALAPLRVRDAWIGARACIVAPCREAADGTGPVGSAFAALAHRLGGVRPRDPAAVAGKLGARWAPLLFSHVGVVVDATWWAHADDDEIVEVQRCIGYSHAADDDVVRADRWLAAQVGRTAPTGDVRVRGTAARSPWPTIPAPHVDTPWARRTAGGLWRTAPAVPARGRTTPGSLARAWDEYRREGNR